MHIRHHRVCHLCEALCGITIEVEGGEIRAIRGDEHDPFSKGHICPKATALKDVHEDPDRLKLPQKREGDRWHAVSWQEALDDVARRLVATQAQHGNNAVALYQGNPTVHNYGALLFGQLFAKTLRTRNKFSATSVDQLPHMLAAFQMFGSQVLLPVPDVDRTSFMLMLGANPLASNGSLMTAPGVEKRLRALRERGGTLVVVDPRRTETAHAADRHIFLRPGTDALFLLSFLNVLFDERLTRPGRLAPHMRGIDEIERVVRPYPPEKTAAVTGVDAVTLRELARRFASTQPAVCYGRVGLCTNEFGGVAAWLVNVVNAVTGNLDRAGGYMFPRPAFDLVALANTLGQRGGFARGHSRVRNLPEFGGEYPAFTLADEIETPGKGQVRALVTQAGNPVLSVPGGARLDSALARLDFYVAIDIYRNETTRHAHYILPPTFALEHDHYDVAFHALAVRNTARYSLPLFPKASDQRHDHEILAGLASRIEALRGGPRGAAMARALTLAADLGPRAIVDLGLRAGPYGFVRTGAQRGLSIDELLEHPHGVDLGALTPCLPERLQRAPRVIELAPEIYLRDIPRLERSTARLARSEGSLTLIGRRDLRSNNSWMHNSRRLTKGRPRCTLLMHPRDAEARGLERGDMVRLSSRAGSVEAPLELTDDMMPGVVSLPHGWGHARPGASLRVAAETPGVSVNDVTDDRFFDELSGTAALSGVEVEVSLVERARDSARGGAGALAE